MKIQLIGLVMVASGFIITFHAITSYHIMYEADIVSQRVFISMMLGLFGMFFMTRDEIEQQKQLRSDNNGIR